MPAGVYELSINGQQLTDLAGNFLDADGDGQGGDSYVLRGDVDNSFYVLKAEWNGDTGVSVFDFTTFSYWFSLAIPRAPAYADLNNDGGVSVFDFIFFANNFGIGVTFPIAFAAVDNANLLNEHEDLLERNRQAIATDERLEDAALLEFLNDWSDETRLFELARRARIG